jgi:hypothetical protein
MRYMFMIDFSLCPVTENERLGHSSPASEGLHSRCVLLFQDSTVKDRWYTEVQRSILAHSVVYRSISSRLIL